MAHLADFHQQLEHTPKTGKESDKMSKHLIVVVVTIVLAILLSSPSYAQGRSTPTATPAATEEATETPVPTALRLYDDNGNGRITCAEARNHGIAPVRRDHPAYQFMTDRNNDGIVCESAQQTQATATIEATGTATATTEATGTATPIATTTPAAKEAEDVDCFRADGGHNELEEQIKAIVEEPEFEGTFTSPLTATDENGDTEIIAGLTLVLVMLTADDKDMMAVGTVVTDTDGFWTINAEICDIQGLRILEVEMGDVIYESEAIAAAATTTKTPSPTAAAATGTPVATATPTLLQELVVQRWQQRLDDLPYDPELTPLPTPVTAWVAAATFLLATRDTGQSLEDIEDDLLAAYQLAVENIVDKCTDDPRVIIEFVEAVVSLAADFGQGDQITRLGVIGQIALHVPNGSSVNCIEFLYTFLAGEDAMLTAAAAIPMESNPISSGTYIVGVDIAPGLYRGEVPEDAFGCTWKRLSSFRGDSDSVIESDLVTAGQYYIEVVDSDYAAEFTCPVTAFSTETATPVEDDDTKLGVYIVGFDIAPGLYRGEVPEDAFGCTWKRLSSFRGDSDSVIESDLVTTGQYYIEVVDSDYAAEFTCPVVAFSTETATPVEDDDTKLGAYIVGFDIAPGLYRGEVPEDAFGCTWKRLSSFRGDFDSIIESDLVTAGQYYIEVVDSDYAAESTCPVVAFSTETATPVEDDDIKLGAYIVGFDIAPGLYRGEVPEDAFGCTWKRLSSFRGDFDSIIESDLVTAGQYYIEVVDSDYAAESTCPVVAFSTETATPVEDDDIKLGAYIVGFDIAPGLYRGEVPEDAFGCTWKRLSSFRGDFDSIIESDLVTAGQYYIEVLDSDYAAEFTCPVAVVDK